MAKSKDWETAWTEKYPKFKKLRQVLPTYSYKNVTEAVATDEKVCEMFIQQIERCRQKLFDIIETSYELAKEKKTGKSFQRLRDDLEILRDEIKIKEHEWDNIHSEAIKILIELDYYTHILLADIEMALNEIFDYVLNYKTLKKGAVLKVNRKIVYEKDFWGSIKNLSKRLEQGVDVLEKKVKERDMVFNINIEDVDDTLKGIIEEIDEFERKK